MNKCVVCGKRKKVMIKNKKNYFCSNDCERKYYIKGKEMPFIEQVQPLIGLKVKKITTIELDGKERVAIIFNDRFGTALFFTKGKFYGMGVTTNYMA